MKKNKTISGEDAALFRESISGARKIAQDTVVHKPKRSTRKIAPEKCCKSKLMPASISQMNFSHS